MFFKKKPKRLDSGVIEQIVAEFCHFSKIAYETAFVTEKTLNDFMENMQFRINVLEQEIKELKKRKKK